MAGCSVEITEFMYDQNKLVDEISKEARRIGILGMTIYPPAADRCIVITVVAGEYRDDIWIYPRRISVNSSYLELDQLQALLGRLQTAARMCEITAPPPPKSITFLFENQE